MATEPAKPRDGVEWIDDDMSAITIVDQVRMQFSLGRIEDADAAKALEIAIARLASRPQPAAGECGDLTSIEVDIEQIGSCTLDIRNGKAYMPAITVMDIVSKSCLRPAAGEVPTPDHGCAYEYTGSTDVCAYADALEYGDARAAAAVARHGGEQTHPDDGAVDRFAEVMKAKLAAARAKGRGGWDGPECNAQVLSDMLRAHVEKGDPRDVANFCMFLHQRGEAIQPAKEP
jgi:hypothetical protein